MEFLALQKPSQKSEYNKRMNLQPEISSLKTTSISIEMPTVPIC